MKLQSQYNRITILTTLLIILVAGVGTYFILHTITIQQLDEDLKIEEVEIHDHISKFHALPPASVYKDQRISYAVSDAKEKRRFQSLEIFDSTDNEKEPSRQLLFPVTVNGQTYLFSVTKSEEATRDLVWIILVLTVALTAILSLILFFTNRFLFRKLWQPFRQTLSVIKEFKVSAPVALEMPETNITEFKDLNENIRLMTNKVMKDYQSLKNFTDHASHEMQTPLAVINSKLDVLIQEPELSGNSMQQIQGLYTSVEKLSRLCQSLLVLARIENNQYAAVERVSIDKLLEEKIKEMQEWSETALIKLKTDIKPLTATMNKQLAEILVNNLVRNSLLHNKTNGVITIASNIDTLTVSNSGDQPLDKEKIFNRFYKSEQSGGTGLGLAIIKQICDNYQFPVIYEFRNQEHHFTTWFGKKADLLVHKL